MTAKANKNKHLTTYDIGDELGIVVYTPKRFIEHAILCAQLNRPLLVLGRPGTGKTNMIEQVTKLLNKMMITKRLNGCDPTDMGLPYVYDDAQGIKRHGWTVPNFFLSTAYKFPEEYSGGATMFFDESAQAVPMMQNRTGEILDRFLNGVPLHEKVNVVMAANFAQDKAATFPIPRQISNRCSVVILAQSQQDLIEYCQKTGVRTEISAFIKLCGDECLDSYDADSMVNCTARSLLALSPVLDKNLPPDQELDVFSSYIGKGWAAQLAAFRQTWRNLPTIEEIIKNPMRIPLPTDDQTDVLCAVSGMVARALAKTNAVPLVKYLTRLPPEFCVFALTDASRREPKLLETAAFCEWAREHGDILINI